MGKHRTPHYKRSSMLSMEIFWMHQGGLFLFFLILGTVSGMDPSSPSMSDSQLSTLGSQLMQLQEQVEALQQDKLEDKEQIVQLMKITEELGNRVSLLKSKCGSADMETDTETSGPLMAIGGYDGNNDLSSAEVLNTSCDFPLPEARYGHMSVTTTDGKTLVCGGSIGYPEHTASCLQFDYESKSWKEHSTLLSTDRIYSSAVTLSRGTYVLGGGDQWTTGSSSEFLATGSSVWTQGPRIPGYGRGVWQSCAVKLSDTEFVILGGSYDLTQARVYNVERNKWREWPRLTVGVRAQSCVGLGDILLMAGGMDSTSLQFTGRTVIFDTKTGAAREVASLKYPRWRAAIELYQGKVVILGGADGIEVRSDGEMWNMDTETWEDADIHLNIARGTFSLATMAEEIDCD